MLFKIFGLLWFPFFFIVGAHDANINIKRVYSANIRSINPKQLIVGTWDMINPHIHKIDSGNQAYFWTFKANGLMKMKGDEEYSSYKLVKGATHKQCPDTGMTASSGVYDSNQLVLIIIPQEGSNSCYKVSYLGYNKDVKATLMSLWYAPTGDHLVFQKRK